MAKFVFIAQKGTALCAVFFFARAGRGTALAVRNGCPTTGRFLGVGPLADKYAELSPYNFAFNDPANVNDPTGADPPLSPGTMRLVANLFEFTPENGSSYWGPGVGGTANDAFSTMQLVQAGAYNGLGGGVNQFQEGGGSARYGSFTDGQSTVAAHSVSTNTAIIVSGFSKAASSIESQVAYMKQDAQEG